MQVHRLDLPALRALPTTNHQEPLNSGLHLNKRIEQLKGMNIVLNPFEFRASFNPSVTFRQSASSISLNPFEFRASFNQYADPAARAGYRFNPFEFRASFNLHRFAIGAGG